MNHDRQGFQRGETDSPAGSDDGLGKRAVAPQERWDGHITRIYPHARLNIHYQNHLEAIYCISGTGSIEDTQADEVHVVRPNIIYAFDKHNAQLLCAETKLVLAYVFVPPLGGREVHDETGDLMSP